MSQMYSPPQYQDPGFSQTQKIAMVVFGLILIGSIIYFFNTKKTPSSSSGGTTTTTPPVKATTTTPSPSSGTTTPTPSSGTTTSSPSSGTTTLPPSGETTTLSPSAGTIPSPTIAPTTGAPIITTPPPDLLFGDLSKSFYIKNNHCPNYITNTASLGSRNPWKFRYIGDYIVDGTHRIYEIYDSNGNILSFDNLNSKITNQSPVDDSLITYIANDGGLLNILKNLNNNTNKKPASLWIIKKNATNDHSIINLAKQLQSIGNPNYGQWRFLTVDDACTNLLNVWNSDADPHQKWSFEPV